MAKSRRKLDDEVGSGEDSESDEDDEVEDDRLEPPENARIWKECRDCKVLTLKETCAEPCPEPPLAAKLVFSRIDSNVRLFEAVCLRGGFSYLTAKDWEQIESELHLNHRTAKAFYEINLWDIERQQTAQAIKVALKAAGHDSRTKRYLVLQDEGKKPIDSVQGAHEGSNHKSSGCGACEGCLKDDCGLCLSCRDKLSYGGAGSKRPCDRLICTAFAPHEEQEVPGEKLVQWQRALIASAVFGGRLKHHFVSSCCRCYECDCDVTFLSARKQCADCGLRFGCDGCVTDIGPWTCMTCRLENAPTWITTGACVSCAQTFTQTRLSQPCIECGSPFCSACVATELQRDADIHGAGLRCFYCRIWHDAVPCFGQPSEPGFTKRIRVVASQE